MGGGESCGDLCVGTLKGEILKAWLLFSVKELIFLSTRLGTQSMSMNTEKEDHSFYYELLLRRKI